MHVSVVMPAYNVAAYLPLAIESTLAQTHRDFELILIDDGSTDATLEIASKYAAQDPRLRLYTQPNAGIANTLNRGLALARHEWIVRMDGDDIMLPHRIERQIAFVQRHPELAVAASWVFFINPQGRIIYEAKSPLTNHAAVAQAYGNNEVIALTHPSVILRKSVIQAIGGYRPAFDPVDDLDLWNRLVERDYKMLVQREFLLKYRIHPGSICTRRATFVDRRIFFMRRCMLQRRQGRPEPTWRQFIRPIPALPWLGQLLRDRCDLAEQYFGLALWRYERREQRLFVRSLLAASLLRPIVVPWRILGKALAKLFPRQNAPAAPPRRPARIPMAAQVQ